MAFHSYTIAFICYIHKPELEWEGGEYHIHKNNRIILRFAKEASKSVYHATSCSLNLKLLTEQNPYDYTEQITSINQLKLRR